MNTLFKNLSILATTFLLATILFTSCKKNPVTPSVQVNFRNATASVSSTQKQAEIAITFSRAVAQSGTLRLTVTPNDLKYGGQGDFYTDPATAGTRLSLSYNKGAESVKFKVIAGTKLNIQQDKSLSIALDAVPTGLQIGASKSVTIMFSKNFTATTGKGTLNAGGADFPNQFFFDLSKNKGTSVGKYTWDLGFYTQAGSHQVIINNPAYQMARPLLSKTDLNQVTDADVTTTFKAAMQVGYRAKAAAAPWVDAPDLDWSKSNPGRLAITVSATATDNKVYILKRNGNDKSGAARGWKKVRILRKGEGYTLQYADIAATSFKTLDVTKDATDNFVFVNVAATATKVTVEPKKIAWDIMYSTYTALAGRGNSPKIPYGYKDFITLNANHTQAAQVMIATKTYEAFAKTDIASLTFSSKINTIGSSWRTLGMSSQSLNADRFYVIKDAQGNHYKLKFTAMKSSAGVRGQTIFEFKLVE